MIAWLVPLAGTILGGLLFVSRGKAHIGDTVEVLYKPGGAFGDQGMFLQGKVIGKTNPVLGPYYEVQLFKAPEAAVLENALNPDMVAKFRASIPSTIGGLKDADIVRNLSRTPKG